jgi:thioredoxin reductase/NAD-dependent dihydropyrimidine dehydrogenase PreA subunit
MTITYLLPYLAILLFFVLRHLWRRRRKEAAHAAELAEAKTAGRMEPATLHPVVNPTRCIGSGSCANACPEEALGIINGKAVLTNPAACIGHGACHAACPVEAITLVFGTERRGIDIPNVTPDFESNIPGLFIAGELGGMGLIRNAAQQGRQAMDAVMRRKGAGSADLDVLIVGAGPAGLSAGLSALDHRLKYRLIEQEDSLGGTVYHYPRNKIAMTAPVKLAIVGTVKMGEISKESLLEFWQGVVRKTGLQVSFRERMENLRREADGTFTVQTNQGSYRARSVLLAIGRRGSPRKLGVPGEDAPHVVYRLIDPEQYRGQHVVVVGGGDSALEAAIALAEQPGGSVTLSYRSPAFSRVKQKNLQRWQELDREGRIRSLLSSEVESIEPGRVTIRKDGVAQACPGDAVIICAGGVLPKDLLEKVGIGFETKFGTA